MPNYKNKGGYMGIIAILIVVAFAVLWMAYLWRQNIVGGLNVNISGNEESKTEPPKQINEQLNDLKKDIKDIQNKKDQEVYDNLK